MQKNQVKTANKVENKTANLDKVNLSKFAEKLSKVEVKEKKKKSLLYKYPEGFTEAMINSDEGKRFRSKCRTALKRFCNNIFVFAKINSVEKLKAEISAFKIFYKENYLVNDFSLNSLTSKADEKTKGLQLMLEIIKEFEK